MKTSIGTRYKALLEALKEKWLRYFATYKLSHNRKMSKLYVLNYNEVQIAGYRIFVSFEEALKEYLKHCILETRELLKEDCGSEPVSELSESESEEEDAEEEPEEAEEFDEMSCTLEVQELQDNEYVTTKEWDYEAFQALLDEKEDIPAYLEELEQQLEAAVPEDLKAVFAA